MAENDGGETGARTPSDFDVLLGRSGSAPGTAAPVYTDTAPHVLDFSDRPRRAKPKASVLEWVGLVLAVIAPPLGLVVTVVARVVARTVHHWTTTVAKVATVVSIVLTLVLAGGAVAYSVISGNEAAEAAVIAKAQPLCDALAATPGVLDLPAYGWPTEVAPLATTLESMKTYQAHWTELTAVAPQSAKANLEAISGQAGILVTAVESTRAIDRAGNLSKMKAVTDVSGLPAWTEKYCG
jgi:hypothetical protein